MRKIFGRNVLRTSAFALTCLALAGTHVMASTLSSDVKHTTSTIPSETYSTTGSIGTTGVTNSNGDAGPGPIGFTQVTNGSFGLSSQVSLGAFAVSTLADNSTTTYKDTPFTLTYNPLTVVAADASAADKFPNAPITISGVLNGFVQGNVSTVKATFNAIDSPVFQTKSGNYLSSISLATNPLTLVPSTSFNGLTTIQAAVTTTAAKPGDLPPPLGDGNGVPEPTTLAILATSIVGFGLRQRLRARKSA